jgi:uncharacterized protein
VTDVRRDGGGGTGLQIVSTAPPLTGPAWISQGWRDVVFVHWHVDVSAVEPLLPVGVHADTTEDGTTWVGLIAFRFVDTAFRWIGPTGSVGDFVEINVRVYTVDEQGRHGVVFLSLDASKLAPVVGARAITGLPYHWAQAEARVGSDGHVAYAMRRHGTRLRSRIDVQVGSAIAEPTELDAFLTARWGMHVRRGGVTRFWPNEHETWQLHRASVGVLHDDLLGAAGLPMSLAQVAPDSVLYSPGVVTRFGSPRR